MPQWLIDLSRIAFEGVTYDLIKLILGPLIMTAAAAYILRLFKRFEKTSEIVYFSIASFVGIFALVFIVTPRTQGPQLAGGIQNVIAGGINGDQDTVAVFSVNVLNAGSMQSIVKNWNVTATINSRIYQGSFLIPAPKDFTFNNATITPGSPTSITYHGSDNILDKAMIPIPQGGITAGVLFVLFRGVAPSVFKVGADYTLSYEDALSKKYTVLVASSAQSGPITLAAGIHADLMCPAQSPPAPMSTPILPLSLPGAPANTPSIGATPDAPAPH